MTEAKIRECKEAELEARRLATLAFKANQELRLPCTDGIVPVDLDLDLKCKIHCDTSHVGSCAEKVLVP